MTEALIGIVVGVAVALAAQVISFVSDRHKQKQAKRGQREAVLKLLHHEVEHHRGFYKFLDTSFQRKIEEYGLEHTGYSYAIVQADAYEKVFLVYWHLLPDEVIEPVIGYYGAVHQVNSVSGDLIDRSPVPIERTQRIMKGAWKRADELKELLEKYLPAS